jgi:hypothetical protein
LPSPDLLIEPRQHVVDWVFTQHAHPLNEWVAVERNDAVLGQ